MPDMTQPAIVPQATRDPEDRETHIERLNRFENPADGSGTRRDAPTEKTAVRYRGERKVYRTLTKSFHDGRIVPPGSMVMLFDEEVGPHHALVAPPEEPKSVEADMVEREAAEFVEE